MAPDPESIDLDNPEASGIGRAPRAADMSIRTMCHSTLMAAERVGVPQIDWTDAAWTAWFLRKHGVEKVREIARGIEGTCAAIINEESSLEATPAKASGSGPVGHLSAPNPDMASADAGVTSADDHPNEPKSPDAEYWREHRAKRAR
jgi:hypothetical protein